MPAGTGSLGRKLIVTWNGTRVAGAREKSLKLNGAEIDVSDDASSGWRELLAEDGVLSVDITIAGVTKTDVLRAAKIAGGAATIAAVTLTYENGAIFSGDFKLEGYGEAAPYSGAQTFDASLHSTGPVTYIAGS